MPKIFKDKNNNVLYTGYETSEIVANPTLAGTEANLTGLQVGNIKYAVPQSGGGGSANLYKYVIDLRNENIRWNFNIYFISPKYVFDVDTDALRSGALTDIFGLSSNLCFNPNEYSIKVGNDVLVIREIIANQTDSKITSFTLIFYNLTSGEQTPYDFQFDSSLHRIDLSGVSDTTTV